MLKEDRNEKRTERHAVTQEDFTPRAVVDDLLSHVPDIAFSDFSKTVLDTSCGNGNILVAVLERRLSNCRTDDDALGAVRTLHGVELMQDNADECRKRLLDCIKSRFPDAVAVAEGIIWSNIRCADFLKKDEPEQLELF